MDYETDVDDIYDSSVAVADSVLECRGTSVDKEVFGERSIDSKCSCFRWALEKAYDWSLMANCRSVSRGFLLQNLSQQIH